MQSNEVPHRAKPAGRRSIVNSVVLGMLRLRARRAGAGSMLGLRIRGRRTGRLIVLPVQFVVGPDGLVVFPSHPDRKQWWHNLVGGAGVKVLDRGVWVGSRGRVVTPGDDEYMAAATAYRAKWPQVRMPPDSPLVVIDEPAHERG